ncbi:MAG: alkaline phosphatase family protein [Deltaproteobacteria bacterium]|nr:alkaline phosphatase family protein [Deltaproteobacteria bacterium]
MSPARSRLLLSAVSASLVLALLACRSPWSRPPLPPRLVVVLVVDQLRPDRLSAALPDGLGRLMREGRVFSQARLDYAFSETCPGHASVSTGLLPRRTGIPANRFVADGGLSAIYCVLDATPTGALVGPSPTAGGGPGRAEAGAEARPVVAEAARGRSPLLLRSDGWARWLKSAHASARVHAVSGKDRAAILLAGHAADGAWWLDRKGSGAFVTSRYYREHWPEWAAGWDGARVRSAAPREWRHPAHDPQGRIRRDDYRAEDPRFSRVSPHPLDDPADPQGSLARLGASPYLDRIVIDFALELARAEALGEGDREATDLLAIGLSATDLIGHLYGPFSQESRAALADLDEAIGELLFALEARLGRDGFGVVLTADHGVLPLPEWVQEANRPENGCAVAGGRIDADALVEALRTAADDALGTREAARGPWLALHGLRIHLNHARLMASGTSRDSLESVLRERLVAQPGIDRVYDREQVAAVDVIEGPGATSGADDMEMRRLIGQAQPPGRGADLFVVPQPGCLLTSRQYGTSHGSPHDYDRRIPLVFWGPGIAPRVDPRPARLVDLAPTLAAWLDVGVPADLDGRALPLH